VTASGPDITQSAAGRAWQSQSAAVRAGRWWRVLGGTELTSSSCPPQVAGAKGEVALNIDNEGRLKSPFSSYRYAASSIFTRKISPSWLRSSFRQCHSMCNWFSPTTAVRAAANLGHPVPGKVGPERGSFVMGERPRRHYALRNNKGRINWIEGRRRLACTVRFSKRRSRKKTRRQRVKKEETKPRDYSECDPAPESQTPSMSARR